MHRFLTALCAVIALILIGVSSDARAEDGKQIFLKSECNECHTVEVLKIAKLEPKQGAAKDEADDEDLAGGKDEDKKDPPDLSGIGKKHDADWFSKWLTKKVKNDDGKRHRKKFKGTDAELASLVGFLSDLKTDAPSKPGK
jgi:mono/diheme cytochrome c family protein